MRNYSANLERKNQNESQVIHDFDYGLVARACKKCGHEAGLFLQWDTRFSVKCPQPCGTVTALYYTSAEAVRAWNEFYAVAEIIKALPCGCCNYPPVLSSRGQPKLYDLYCPCGNGTASWSNPDDAVVNWNNVFSTGASIFSIREGDHGLRRSCGCDICRPPKPSRECDCEIYEVCGICKPPAKIKPPLGVKPRNLWLEARVTELTRAIGEYEIWWKSRCHLAEAVKGIELLNEWRRELRLVNDDLTYAR